MECVFCKIVSSDIPAKILQTTEHSIAFLDAFPLAKGHTLVIPKKHHQKLGELDNLENSDLFALVNMISSRVDTLTGSTLIAIHNGKQAGQDIPHVHVHIIPRSEKDGAGPIHSMFKKNDITSDDVYDKLKISKETASL